MHGLKYAFTEAVASLTRGWRSSLVAVITIAAGLFVFGFFLIANANLQRLVGRWTEAAELSVYLNDDATPEQIHRVDQLVDGSGLVAERRFVSKADAAQRFRDEFPDLAVAAQGLGRNPFPASVEVRLARHGTSGEAVETLASTLASAPGVVDVQYDRRWLARLDSLIRLARAVALLVVAILGVAAALTVASVVRLAADARRDEIEIMRLVGAPLAYIRGPFVAEGVLQGGAGALAAIVLLWVVFAAGWARFGQLASEALGIGTLTLMPVDLALVLLAGGMLLGCLGGLIVARTVR